MLEENSSKTLNVLIVEDSYFFSRWLCNELLNIGSINITAVVDNAHDAMKIISEADVDLAIVDVRLKEGLGTDILKSIKTTNSKTKVIIFTNHAEFKKECLKLGADYFYDKSNEFDELIESIINLSAR